MLAGGVNGEREVRQRQKERKKSRPDSEPFSRSGRSGQVPSHLTGVVPVLGFDVFPVAFPDLPLLIRPIYPPSPFPRLFMSSEPLIADSPRRRRIPCSHDGTVRGPVGGRESSLNDYVSYPS